MNDSKLNKTQFAEKIDMPEPKWSKISNGIQKIDLFELSKIAEKLQMREIDIFTYPDIYVLEKEENRTRRILVELDVTDDEFRELGLRSKIKQIIDR